MRWIPWTRGLRSPAGRECLGNGTERGEASRGIVGLETRDLPDLAVELLLAEIDDLEIAELVGEHHALRPCPRCDETVWLAQPRLRV